MERAAVVVTYNRIECLKRNLECLRQQTLALDKIYVVDNASTDGTRDYLYALSEKWSALYVVSLIENIGGSGGFYTGIDKAFKEGADWIWGMDDDAYPEQEALEVIEAVAKKDNFQNVYWSNCNQDVEFLAETKDVSEWMFVGFFLTKRAVELAGLPRKDFFIYHDDVEYAYRIQRKGLRVIKVRDSIISHGATVDTALLEKKVLGKNLRYPVMSDWKHYYYIRNYILRYDGNLKMKLKTIFLWMPWFFIKICLIKPRMLPKFLKGYIHGILGITGVKERP